MKWYKHESTANLNDKLQEVLLDYGYEGYGLYWYCLELIAFGVDAENLTFELKHDARIIARNGGCSVARVEEIMKKFLELGLFENDGNGRITCLKLAKRADDYTNKLVKKAPLQLIENTQQLETPTKSDKLRESPPRRDKNRLDKKEKETGSDVPACPHEKILDLYHEKLSELPAIRIWTDKRKAFLRARWRENQKRQNLEYWENLFDYIADSDFLCGRVPGRNGRKPFKADLEWLLKPDNFAKVIEGKYDEAA